MDHGVVEENSLIFNILKLNEQLKNNTVTSLGPEAKESKSQNRSNHED